MDGDIDVGLGTEDERELTFEDLYRREYRVLVALAFGLSGSRRAAEELVQEAFLAAHRRWDTIRTYDEPGAWLRRVVINRAVSATRRRLAEARAMTRLRARPLVQAVLPDQDETVWRAIRALPKRQAQVVALRYLDDRSVADIAQLLECTEGTVKTHLHRARLTLAAALGQDDDDAGSWP